MSFAIVSLIILVIVALIAILIFMRVFGEAARRNPNRPGGEGRDNTTEEDQDERSDRNRE
jgi:hypothetical protein